MTPHVVDTHALVWHLTKQNELGSSARQLLAAADAGYQQIIVPSIALVELVYLFERGRIGRQVYEQILGLVSTAGSAYELVPLDLRVLPFVPQVPRTSVPELCDRIITATALAFNAPLITRDHAIINSGVVTTIW